MKTLNWTHFKKMYDKYKITNSVFHEFSHILDCNKLRAYNM